MTLDDALNDPLIRVIDRHDDFGSYAVELGTLKTKVFIELGRMPSGHGVKFRVSHSIHTPTQIDPYKTSRPWNDDEASALNQAITGLTSYYKDAVRTGHTPSEDWLVKN